VPSRPHRLFDDIQNRWTTGTPVVPGIVRRTVTAAAALLVLIGILALLSA
jgi:hypothetical protein